MQELITKTGLVNKELCVAMMARSFSHSDGRGSESQECFSRGPDKLRIGVHWPSRNVFDDVGLKQYGFSANLQIEELKSPVDQFVKFVRVTICVQNCDPRALRTEIMRELALLESQGHSGSSNCSGSN